MNRDRRLILASQSRSRAAILDHAGLSFRILPAAIDEQSIKDRARRAGRTVENTVIELADAKAQAVSRRHPEDYVLGADQILEIDGRWFDKPSDRSEAADHLKAFRGRIHRLVNGLVVVIGGRRVWSHEAIAALTMRPFSDRFLAAYLDGSGPEILESVGAYRLKGRGAQLFERIDGDYFTILGLPLLPLLAFLRDIGLAET